MSFSFSSALLPWMLEVSHGLHEPEGEFISSLELKLVYSDAHHHSISVFFIQKQNALEFLVIPLLKKTSCLWAILYFRN